MKKYIFPIIGAIVIIVLVVAVFKVTAKKVSESPFETQAVETAASETTPEIVVHNEGEDKANIDDLSVNVDKPVYETVGTTEIVETDSEGVEITETIGVVETEAYGGFVGVQDNGDTVAGFNSIPLSSGHQYTDIELLYVDNLIAEYMADEALGEDFITQRLGLPAFSSLSDADKEEIKNRLVTDYPHNSAVGTSEENTETVQETTVADSETESAVVYESDDVSDENYEGENYSADYSDATYTENNSDAEIYEPTGENITYGENWFMEENLSLSDEELAEINKYR